MAHLFRSSKANQIIHFNNFFIQKTLWGKLFHFFSCFVHEKQLELLCIETVIKRFCSFTRNFSNFVLFWRYTRSSNQTHTQKHEEKDESYSFLSTFFSCLQNFRSDFFFSPFSVVITFPSRSSQWIHTIIPFSAASMGASERKRES